MTETMEATSTTTAQMQPRLVWFGVAGCAVALAGSFMPWVTINSVFGSIGVNGTEGDGKITAVLAIVAGLAAILGLNKASRSNVRLAGVVALIGVILSVYELQHVSSRTGGVTGAVRTSVGSGIWLMAAGFVIAVVCLFKSSALAGIVGAERPVHSHGQAGTPQP